MPNDAASSRRTPGHTYAPAFEFYADFDEYEITDYLRVVRYTYDPTVLDKRDCLSGHEIREVRGTNFCFVINEKVPKKLAPQKILNVLLVAFWVLRPSKVYIRFRFGPKELDFSRLLDQFIHNHLDTHKEIYTLDDLNTIKEMFIRLLEVLKKKGRLSNAFDLTFRACMAYSSLVAHVLIAAALESLLTYKRGFKLTERLAKAFACLTSLKKRARDRAFQKFYSVYDFRSDIMHGRMKDLSRHRHLITLGKSTDCLRLTWLKVLQDAELMKVLGDSDPVRQSFFAGLESGYVSPAIMPKKSH
jgi:hypothetical protein